MKGYQSALVFIVAGTIASSLLFAEEKTVSSKVTAVNTAKNTITLNGITLDVTRKTKITVDGKSAELSDIKKGQEATVVYDDQSEVAGSVVVGKEPEKDFEATAKDLKSLQGEWKCIADRNIDKKEVKKQDRRITIQGNSLTMKRTYGDKRGTYEGKFEIDASNGKFDFVGKGPNGGFVEWVGIYKIDGDKLSLSYNETKQEKKAKRPSKIGEGVLQVFVRDND